MGRTPRNDRADSMGSNRTDYAAYMANRKRQLAGTGHAREHLAEIANLPPVNELLNSRETRRLFYPRLNIGIKGAVCERGHVMEEVVMESEEYDEPCPECGSEVITECPKCGLEIDAGEDRVEVTPDCPRCGEPFPWGAGARRAGWLRFPDILYMAAAVATIAASMLYVGTFLG